MRCDGSEVCRIPLLWAERRGRGARPRHRAPAAATEPWGGSSADTPSPLGWRKHRGAGREVGAVGGWWLRRGWVRGCRISPVGCLWLRRGDTLGGWAPTCPVCAGGTGDWSDPRGQQRSWGLCPGWGAPGSTPRAGASPEWGAPTSAASRVPGWLGSAPLPSHPSKARVTSCCPKHPLRGD